MSVKDFEERERDRREKEEFNKKRGGDFHERPDIAPDLAPDQKPAGVAAKRDERNKVVRDRNLAEGMKTGPSRDGDHKEKVAGNKEKLADANKRIDGIEKKQDGIEKKQDSMDKSRESRERDRERDQDRSRGEMDRGGKGGGRER